MDSVFLSEVGAFSMGFLVIWVGFVYLNRGTSFTVVEFGEFITVLFGGAAVSILTTQFDEGTKFIFWYYPIGLVAGMFAYHYLGGGNITKTPDRMGEEFWKFAKLTGLILVGFGILLSGLSLAGFAIGLWDGIGFELALLGILALVITLKYFGIGARGS